jgi:hypothetical protein
MPLTQELIEERQRRMQRVDRIYQTLDDRVMLVEDPDLQDEILDWQDRADEMPAASLLDHVESVLSQMETTNEMYREGLDGEENFPDRCEGCEHYGVACPLFSFESEKLEREQLQDELVGASEDEVKARLRKLAGRVGCHVIVEEIEAWTEDHAELLQEGRDLRRKTVHILRPADADERGAERAAEYRDGGSR